MAAKCGASARLHQGDEMMRAMPCRLTMEKRRVASVVEERETAVKILAMASMFSMSPWVVTPRGMEASSMRPQEHRYGMYARL